MRLARISRIKWNFTESVQEIGKSGEMQTCPRMPRMPRSMIAATGKSIIGRANSLIQRCLVIISDLLISARIRDRKWNFI